MMDVEHQESLEKEQLLDKIESLYEQSRDISYLPSRRVQSDFQKSVTNLLSSFADENTKVLIVGNDNNDLWIKISDGIKEELEHVLRELMINMKKHSFARNVVVKFERQGDFLNVQYTDDGVGLPSPLQYGNGLSNTGNRINGISGRIIFDENTTKGAKIQVHIPIV
jgi:signal transduction histidine kinase